MNSNMRDFFKATGTLSLVIIMLIFGKGNGKFVYLDDRFDCQHENCSAITGALIQQKELDSSGLLANEEKSHWVTFNASW